MSEKKNIDIFFQERLEQFEVTPPEMAWNNIEAKLNEKKEKRRVIPFWWKLSGIAAILLIGLGLYTSYFNGNSVPNHPIVNRQDATPNYPKETRSEANEATIPSSDTTINKETVVQSQKNTNDNNANEEITTNLATEKKHNSTLSNKNQKNNIAAVPNDKRKASNSKGDLVSISNQLDSNQKKHNSNKHNLNSRKEIASTTIKETIQNESNNTIVDFTNPAGEQNTITNIDRKTALSIMEEMGKQDQAKSEEIKKIDSTKVATVEPNALEELLNEKEKKITKEPKLNRWQVAPNVAPIYFSSLTNGSPLDEKLEANQKVYGTNYSYGLTVNYALNKKYSIRTGIHSYSVDYDTKGIVFYQDSSPSKIQNLNPNTQGLYIQIDPLTNVNSSFGRMIGEKFEGTLNQKMGYIEIPLEVTYKLLSKKLGIDVIGGLSTLFLNQNEVYLKSTGFNMKIGEASNLNTVHFSTNIGLGMKYSFLKQLDARLEPIFKYQINTYSSGAGNFKPYIFGIYTGLTYHF